MAYSDTPGEILLGRYLIPVSGDTLEILSTSMCMYSEEA
jgi:hypothetical protein